MLSLNRKKKLEFIARISALFTADEIDKAVPILTAVNP
jgi:hypothetical protein